MWTTFESDVETNCRYNDAKHTRHRKGCVTKNGFLCYLRERERERKRERERERERERQRETEKKVGGGGGGGRNRGARYLPSQL